MDNQDLKTAEILHPLDKLGQYALTGVPGRPKGLKNKYTKRRYGHHSRTAQSG